MALTGWSETINDEGHMLIIEWSLTWIEAPLRLPCCSFYINQSLLMSFLYFLLKPIIRAHLSSLSNNTVQLLHPSYIFSLSTFNLVSILVNSSSIFLLQTFYVSVIPYKLVKVIGFTITCRSCLVCRVTIRLSAMEWATMKYTRQVTKTMIVRVKKGIRQLVLLPQGIRVWSGKSQRMTSFKTRMIISHQYNLLWALMDLGK